MSTRKYLSNETGVALVTALLVMMLMGALMVGMFAALATDTRSHAADRDQTQAYAAAQAGLEKLTSALAQLFVQDPSPSVAQINTIASTPPVIPNFSFVAPGGAPGTGYAVTWSPDPNSNPPGNPRAFQDQITTGPYTGFQGLITKYTATITAASRAGAEVRLRREIQTVAVPVFQFGMFSDSDLSIFAGDNFSFGGRVHTNGSLFVCEQTGTGTMTFNDRITALNQVVHNYFSNGVLNTSSNPSCTSNVLIPTSPTTNRNLKQSPNEGSVTGMPGSAANPNWTTISTGTYKSYIRTGLTGAKRLDLPLVSQGARPIDLLRRPALNSNENIVNAPVYGQRYYAMASLRILLSDRLADFANLPTATAGAPVLLDGTGPVAIPAAGGMPLAKAIGPEYDVAGGAVLANTEARTATINPASTATIIQVENTATRPGIPPRYRMPAPILVNNVAKVCTGKTNNQLLNCQVGVGITINANTPINVNGVATTTNGNAGPAPASGLVNLTLNNPANMVSYPTERFTPLNSFWSDDGTRAYLYTCTGYNANAAVGANHSFTGCAGGPAPDPTRPITTGSLVNANEGTIGGYIKIEKQDNAGAWSDVTMEILNLGIGAPNQVGGLCPDLTANAIIRIQRLRDNGGNGCPYAAAPNAGQNATDWWPQTLYDPREGSFRSIATTAPLMMAGVIQYISLDTNNLRRWFAGAIPAAGATGAAALNNNGYIVYFSDCRGNHDTGNADVETGEFGFEDQVNPTTAAGTPDGVPQVGEDMNGNTLQETYGRRPSAVGNNILAGARVPYDGTANSNAEITMPQISSGPARVNKVVLFRRALKLVNGGINGGVNNLPASGLTVASENPVYVQGNYNAIALPNATWSNAEPNVPAAILADAITLLSNAWTDANSFTNPNAWSLRDASNTGWRFAAVAGKGVSFPFCGAACGGPGDLYGTDGGASNFLRLLEDWNNAANPTIAYRGSLISLYNSRQAIGNYKFPQTHIYNGGLRNFTFDTDFLTPALLPPGTPMFRDVNTLKFRQILRPNQ